MKEILMTVCGRGGSKGVPGKNVRPFLGVPLIALTLYDAVLAFEGFSGVSKTLLVDSDSQEILDVARNAFPQVLCHRRKSALAQDSTPKLSAISDALRFAEEETGQVFDFIIDLDITSPLRTAQDVEDVLAALEREPNLDVVFSVVPARRNPYFNMVEEVGLNRVVRCKEGHFVTRQEAPAVYDMNASIYAYRRDVFLRGPLSPLDLDGGIHVMKDYGILDIDSEEDWELMELLYGHHARKPGDGYLKAKLDASRVTPRVSGRG